MLPDSSLDNEVVRFNGTTGTSIQGSNVLINDTQGITGAKSLTISTGATNPGSDTTLWVRDSVSHLLFGAVDLLARHFVSYKLYEVASIRNDIH